MASLTSILQAKGSQIQTQTPLNAENFGVEETNLFDADISVFTAANYLLDANCVDWVAPAAGTVTLEVWGAGGSGGRMCCCGFGIPGNPGAYSKKTLTVVQGDTISGLLGHSCGNASSLCYRGRSQSTGVCYITAGGTGCICAEGGFGGVSLCSTGTAPYTCFAGRGYCGEVISGSCGVICNFAGDTLAVDAQSFGGDINCNGGISRMCFNLTTPNDPCYYIADVAVPPGIYTTNGSRLSFGGSIDSGATQQGANDHGIEYFYNIGSMGRSLGQGGKLSFCWAGNVYCGCYDFMGCEYVLPYGFPGTSATPCSSVRSSGMRGGPGAVKIKFVGS